MRRALAALVPFLAAWALAAPAPAQFTPEVVPAVNCVTYDPDTEVVTALLGYVSTHTDTVEIPVGEANFFFPDPLDQGQPTEFAPGVHDGVFTVSFSDDPVSLRALTWRLDGNSVTSRISNKRCNTDTVFSVGEWQENTTYHAGALTLLDSKPWLAWTDPGIGRPGDVPAWLSFDGPTGDAGAAGPAGPTGDAGAAGQAGPSGAQGDPGEKGPSGDPGPTGPTGDSGAKGDAGPTGPTGARGDTGAAGPKGATGSTGARGPKGPRGDAGEAGPAGPAGRGATSVSSQPVRFDWFGRRSVSDPKVTSTSFVVIQYTGIDLLLRPPSVLETHRGGFTALGAPGADFRYAVLS